MKRLCLGVAVASIFALATCAASAAMYTVNFTFSAGPNPQSGVVTFDAAAPSGAAVDVYLFGTITNFTADFSLGGVTWDETQMEWKEATPAWTTPIGDNDFWLTHIVATDDWYWDDSLNGSNDQNFLRFVNGADTLYFDEGDFGSHDYMSTIGGASSIGGTYTARSGKPGGGDVPEPTTLAIWSLLSLIGLAVVRRRRRV